MRVPRPLVWIASSRRDLKGFPESAKDVIGYALYLAQVGRKYEAAKPLKGFGSAGVIEIVDDSVGGTIAACTPSDSRASSMCSIASRRSRGGESRRRGLTWTWISSSA